MNVNTYCYQPRDGTVEEENGLFRAYYLGQPTRPLFNDKAGAVSYLRSLEHGREVEA